LFIYSLNRYVEVLHVTFYRDIWTLEKQNEIYWLKSLYI